jgi:hypothetical protein
MGRHAAERGPANDMFMVTVVSSLLVLGMIMLTLAGNWA